MESQEISPWENTHFKQSCEKQAQYPFQNNRKTQLQYPKLIFRNNLNHKMCYPKQAKSLRNYERREIGLQTEVKLKLKIPNPLQIKLRVQKDLPDINSKAGKKMSNSPAINLLKSTYRQRSKAKGSKIDRFSHQQTEVKRNNNKKYDLFRQKYF